MDIQSKPQKLEDIFHGISTRYIVPHYQRDYTWAQDQWAELWRDVKSAFDARTDYFLGSFVLNSEYNEDGQFEIVDGQQRLSTFTILFSAIRDISKFYTENSDHEAFSAMRGAGAENRQRALATFMKASILIVHQSAADNYYLRLNDKDQPIFRDNIQMHSEGEPYLTKESRRAPRSESRLIKCKKFLSGKVLEDFLKNEQGFALLERFVIYCMTKLILLRIQVSSDNDAYLLFETLNDRGLDLSIADLVKNRLLLGCEGDEEKKQRVLAKWNDLISQMSGSRFQTHDFLRFYWCAFEEKCTKKELYRLIRIKLGTDDGEGLLNNWLSSVEFFRTITDKDFKFPGSVTAFGSTECSYSELNSLGYSVHLPLFLYLNRHIPSILDEIARPVVSYLYRVITIGGFSAGRAEKKMDELLQEVKQSPESRGLIFKFLEDPEASDEKFSMRIKEQRFEDNKSARIFLAKWHLSEAGEGHPLSDKVHLEHILPQNEAAWEGFDCGGKERKDWVYALGNMTLLEQSVNKSIKDSVFSTKVGRFRQKNAECPLGSALPMTYAIAKAHDEHQREWIISWIQERTETFSEKAHQLFSLPSIPDSQNND